MKNIYTAVEKLKAKSSFCAQIAIYIVQVQELNVQFIKLR